MNEVFQLHITLSSFISRREKERGKKCLKFSLVIYKAIYYVAMVKRGGEKEERKQHH
jgi:hypothetical protein